MLVLKGEKVAGVGLAPNISAQMMGGQGEGPARADPHQHERKLTTGTNFQTTSISRQHVTLKFGL